jgi:membrane fusion protein YbhG
MNVKQRILLVVVVGLIAVVTTVVLRSRGTDSDVLTASGTVEATDALLGFQSPGRIDTIAVREGDDVTAGEFLAALDQSDLVARREGALASSAAAGATLRELQSGSRQEDIAQARAAVTAAEQRLADAERDVDRSTRLNAGGAVSDEVLDKHTTVREVASADLERIRQVLALVEAGPRPERISAQTAIVQQTEAAVAQIDAAISYASILSPFPGRITVRHREPGEVVAPGAPVLTLMNPEERWVRIYVMENQVGRVSVGQSVSISADAHTDRTYEGIISFIADQAEFTPRNVQTTEERVKLVYEVRVRISGDPNFDLKPGLAADVTIAGG